MKLIGEKIYLRYPKRSDAEWITKEINSKDILPKLFIFKRGKVSLNDEINWIKKQSSLRKKWDSINFVIIDQNTGERIGCCGIHSIKREDNYGELGIWITKKYWGKGQSLDAIKTLMRHGFEKLNFHAFKASPYEWNIQSKKHIEKIGMKYEGTLRDRHLINGKYYSEFSYSITKEEFNAKDRD
jgi:RimJ/RimL family protein N-acetyltransferase